MEEVIISEGIEEIGENAFSGCTSLEHISIPSTLRKIGNYAIPFDRFKYIALPRGLSEIGEGLFENKDTQSQDRLKTQLRLVPPCSNAERYLDEHKLKYRHCGVKFGVATNRKVDNKIFLYSNRIPFGKARIPEDVSIIGDYALAGHTEIKEAVFPRTLVEIKDHAFDGCTNLAKISFNYGLKKIGTKAFCDFDGYIVDLPSTVTEVADDAFPANCVISIHGEMPFHAKKAECIERKKQVLIIEKQKLRVQKIHQRISNIRNDYQNKIICEIVKREPSFICVEDLNVKGMMKNRHLSKAVQQQCFGEFRRQIEYKSTWNNIPVIIADRFFPSSKLCSCCGNIKKDLKLSDRIYKCECGNVIDRDYQAALNLKRYGKMVLEQSVV